MKKGNIITLGCSKNLVESEKLAALLKKNGFDIVFDDYESDAKHVFINTCGFIGDAKEESVNTIFDFISLKKEGQIDKLIVFGCLSQRYLEELKKEIPEVDLFTGTNDFSKIITFYKLDSNKNIFTDRVISTPSHYSYLRISEGCNRSCAFCAIPLIKGKHISEPIENLVQESKMLAESGVKELNIIAQDLSFYGKDLKIKNALPHLLEELVKIDELKRIRLHYAYPAGFPKEILPVINDNPKICNYLDLALQHISNKMLTIMKRKITKTQTIDLLDSIRTQVPGIAIRTSMMVGHPGETKREFDELLRFVEKFKFERLGVFKYSHEEDTAIYKNYKDSVRESTKEKRFEELMQVQQEISYDYNIEKIDQVLDVIVDRIDGDKYIGRTEFDSPEVDNEVTFFSEKTLYSGDIVPVKITRAYEYDLEGFCVE